MKIFSTLILLLNAAILILFFLLLMNMGSVIGMIAQPAFLVVVFLPISIITLIGLLICYNVRIKKRWQTSNVGHRLIWNPVINLIMIIGFMIMQLI